MKVSGKTIVVCVIAFLLFVSWGAAGYAEDHQNDPPSSSFLRNYGQFCLDTWHAIFHSPLPRAE